MKRQATALVLVVVGTSLACGITASVGTVAAHQGAYQYSQTDDRKARKPNIVVILTDDQRRGTFGTMPTVRNRIIAQGRRYPGVAPTSLCCPVRTSLLTGNFSHTTGIYTNLASRHGGWGRFHRTGQERKTLATALNRVGYRTGLFGKYVNGWSAARRGFVPPGWDVFRAQWFDDPTHSGDYYNYWLKGTGSPAWYGSQPGDYSTDVTAKRAAGFVRSTPARRPLFFLWTPYAPHLPMTPAPRDNGTWTAASPYSNRAVNEVRMADKARFLQKLNPVSRSFIAQMRDDTMESLRSVDDGVRRIMDALGRRVHNTLFVFASDQGYLWGEHRMATKYVPYRWTTDYPLFLRWDRHIRHGVSHRLVPHVDISATLLRVGHAARYLNTEGRSLLRTDRARVVLEGVHYPIENTNRSRPAYCGLRTNRYLYVKWNGVRKTELYDYRKDPLELHNRALRDSYQSVRHRLHRATVNLCSPRPRGFHWS